MNSGGFNMLVVRRGVGGKKVIGNILKFVESFSFVNVCVHTFKTPPSIMSFQLRRH